MIRMPMYNTRILSNRNVKAHFICHSYSVNHCPLQFVLESEATLRIHSASANIQTLLSAVLGSEEALTFCQ